MRRVVIFLATGTVLVVSSFLAGRWLQDAKSGYHYQVWEERTYQSPRGPVKWKYIDETVGASLLDPGVTVIEWNDRIIYKTRRIFQERFPAARNVVASGNLIEWDDGEFRFRLAIEEMPKQPTTTDAP